MNPKADRIIRRLSEKGFQAYYAGGCVRDLLLGRASKDFDIATNAQPDQVQDLFERATDLQGKCFGVVRVLSGGDVFEVATFRQDGAYLDGRHPEKVDFSNASAEEDARRRDFTVNGLFYDPIAGKVIDHVGGQEDLKNKIIRAIGDPKDRFQEDALRLFRAVRFAAELDFTIEPVTWKAICGLAPTCQRLAHERVRDELVKCFTGANPARALDLLDESRLLSFWIPEVDRMKGVEQPPQFHPEGDVYTHVHLMMQQLHYPSLTLAFSVLLHDIAKPDTFKVDPSGRIRFNEHESIGARMAVDIMKRLKFSNDEIKAVETCVANHMSFKDAKNMRLSTLKRFLSRPYLEDEMELHRIDCTCSHGMLDIYNFLLEKRAELAHEDLAPPPLISGDDLIQLGLKPGPVVGKILHLVLEEQLEGRLVSREQALGWAKHLAADYVGPAMLGPRSG